MKHYLNLEIFIW